MATFTDLIPILLFKISDTNKLKKVNKKYIVVICKNNKKYPKNPCFGKNFKKKLGRTYYIDSI